MQNTERALFCVPRPATRIHVPTILLFQMRAAFLPVSIFKKLQAKVTLPETGKLSVTLETQTPPIWETCVALRQPPGLPSRGQFANYCRGSRRIDPVTVTPRTPFDPVQRRKKGLPGAGSDRIKRCGRGDHARFQSQRRSAPPPAWRGRSRSSRIAA